MNLSPAEKTLVETYEAMIPQTDSHIVLTTSDDEDGVMDEEEQGVQEEEEEEDFV